MRTGISGKLLFFLIIFSFVFPFIGSVHASASSVTTTGAYDYSIEDYSVEMTVSANREIKVIERIHAYFTGFDSHGIIRDLPIEEGVSYCDLRMSCWNSSDFSPYIGYDDLHFLSVYLRGDGVVRGQDRLYQLSYTMIVPKLKEAGYLPLNVINFGGSAPMKNVSAVIRLPADFEYIVYPENSVDEIVRSDRELSLRTSYLSAYHGITVDFRFADGVLETHFDSSLLYALGLGLFILLAGILIKFLLCKQSIMITSVNLEAPDEMDPLLMGKLIDNRVDNEDLGALVFYLADREYLTIDLQNEENPILRKTEKTLPPETPNHIKVFYDGLFGNRKEVAVSDLTNSFYVTAQSVKANVDLKAGKSYEGRSKVFLGLFSVLTLLLLGGFGLLYGMLSLYSRYFYWGSAVACILAFAFSAVSSCKVSLCEYKWKKSKRIAYLGASFLLSVAVAVLIAFLVKSAAFSIWTNAILIICSALSGIISGQFLVRTKDYSEKLGKILGFKQFILFTERDKIEFMLKENPELYYHVLPYAQVLGVTDAWTDKFDKLPIEPPRYASGYNFDLFDVIIFHHVFCNMQKTMSRTMVSKPSSAGRGTHGGSFGGGFSGGGFGGGGMRGC